MYVCTHARTYVCMYVCMFVCVCVCICIFVYYVHTHIHTYIYIYIYIYTHTHTHTYIHTHIYVYCLIVVHIDGEEIMTENLSSSPMTLKLRSYAGVNMIYSQKGHLFILKFQSYDENMTNAFTLWYIKIAKLCTWTNIHAQSAYQISIPSCSQTEFELHRAS
jgi:hypothetical protein